MITQTTSMSPAESEKAPGSDQKKPSIFKKTWVRILLVLLLVVAVAAGVVGAFHWWTAGRFIESTNDAYIQADKVAVAARVTGAIEKVLVADNQRVIAGQKLAQIDDRDPRARMEQAKTNGGCWRRRRTTGRSSAPSSGRRAH